MTSGLPIVAALNCRKSLRMRQGSALSRPMMRLRAIAATMMMGRRGISDRDRRCDGRMRLVALDSEILQPVVEDRGRAARQRQAGPGSRLPPELRRDEVAMVLVKVHVSPEPDERSRLEIALLRQHADQQGRCHQV